MGFAEGVACDPHDTTGWVFRLGIKPIRDAYVCVVSSFDSKLTFYGSGTTTSINEFLTSRVRW